MLSQRRRSNIVSCVYVAAVSSLEKSASALSLPCSPFQPDTSAPIQRLIDWLDEDDGVGATTIGVSKHGLRGLYATETYDPGEYILAIPSSQCLILYERIYDMLNNDPDAEQEAQDIENGAKRLHQLLQQKVPCDWTSIYLDTLPTEANHFDASPDFWDEELIRQMAVPQLVQDMLERRASQDDFAFTKWLVRSRAFTTFQMLGATDDDTKSRTLRTRTLLIPYIDMLNHSPTSNTIMEKVETPLLADVEEDTSCFSLIATKPILPGDELTLTYGSGYETCLDLITKYGFWLSNNPNDTALDLEEVEWSSSLRDDEELLKQHLAEPINESLYFRNMLELRIHLKRVQQQQKHGL